MNTEEKTQHHENQDKKGILLVLFLVIGLVGTMYSVLTDAGILKLGAFFILIGITIYASWKRKQHVSLEHLMNISETCAGEILVISLLLLIGGGLVVYSLRQGADRSLLGISLCVVSLGGYLLWKHKAVFLLGNIVHLLVSVTAFAGFSLCLTGAVGLLTGYQGRWLYESITRGEAIRNTIVGLGVLGILAIEIWFPNIEYGIQRVIGSDEASMSSWSSF